MDTLFDEIEAFCAAHDLSDSQFGRLAAKDTRLVTDLKAGREPRRAMVEKIRRFMASYTPASRRPFPAPSGGTTEAAAA